MFLSFVIPCYGSEKTISSVIAEIKDTVNTRKDTDFEIICVNDCSPDNVWSVLISEAQIDKRVKLIGLSKNANRPGAVMAGLGQAVGEICVVLDDDGQCPMPELWRLIEPLENGYDVSIADYPVRKQNAFKNFGTAVNKKMTEVIIGRPKNLQFTNFMAIKKFVVDEIIDYRNPYPYLTGLLLRTTQKIKNVPMEQRCRIDNGRTNFTFNKMFSLWINGFTAFSVKPLRIATVCGVIVALIGFVMGIYTVINKILNPIIEAGYSSTMAVMLFIGGMIMLMLGLIGEYIGRIYICINKSPQYVIRDKINIDTEEHKQ